METGYLVLETGEVFEGKLIGRLKDTTGEVVFNTGMTGYQEMMTDPSYKGQILTFCYPLIGNYGINLLDDESDRPQVSGVIIGDMCETPSHFLSLKNLSDQLKESGIIGLTSIDTRALVKVIRKHGTINGRITKQKTSIEEKFKQNWNKFWVEEVSTKEIRSYKNDGPHVVLIDYGHKKSILQALLEEGCSVTVVPYHFSYEQIKALHPNGVLLSNGPGDPMELKPWFQDIKKISESYPTLGICLGHQLLALAYGAKTEKLAYGHRGSNHPVKELTTGKVRMTSQNHGYVVVEDSINLDVFQVTFRNVNDRTVEGLKHMHHPIQAVQFHPEAHPGPSDTAYVFQDFIQQLLPVGEIPYAVM
ncbi:carbamoyl phosphate synthase small subunit [Pseudalkalibacillus decolorationis]|uniref:carbamoyl phosphate synthase small subunit n=1 Tax=Pseudalkalibacillus decolorationis TaxID=163879 RepID=UPI002148DBE0|nr:carbamoyl phosphate synthase small subunit [Pseudalkalibacillus decolorationis]